VRIIHAHQKRVLALALSSSGLLASAGRDRFLRFWTLPQGTPALPEQALLVRSLRFVRQESLLVVVHVDGRLFLVDLDSGGRRPAGCDGASFVLALPDKDSFLYFHSSLERDRRRLVGQRPLVNLREEVRVGSTAYLVTQGSLASHRSLFAGSSGDYTVTIHDAHTFTPFRSLRHRLAVNALTFSPDDRFLVVAAGNQVVLWSVERWEEVGLLALHRGLIRGLACTPDGRTLLTAGLDGQVGCWDLHTFRLRQASQWNISRLRCLALAPDGMTAAVGGDKGQIVVWDLDD
jgi:WD40 repeat protein